MWRVLKRVLWSCEFHTSKTNEGFLGGFSLSVAGKLSSIWRWPLISFKKKKNFSFLRNKKYVSIMPAKQK